MIKRLGCSVRALCPQCAPEADTLTPEEAMVLFSLSWREIVRMVDAGLVHFTETSDGVLFICIDSLAAQRARRDLPQDCD